RFGVKAAVPTYGKDFKVVFEFDLFGVGPDAGQTTIRPRHMYGQWGKFGGGLYADRIEVQNIRPRFPAPDISAEYRQGQKWGYVELAGIVRWFKWDDV